MSELYLEPDTAASIYSPEGNPLEYPCELPARPLLINHEGVIPLSWIDPKEPPRTADGHLVDELLSSRGVASFRERMPQIAFGANRDPKNLRWKFQHYRAQGEAVSSDLILLPGVVTDADVVACNLGYWGYVYAALLLHRPPRLNRPYLQGCQAPVAVLLVDEPQMQALHRSEGVRASSAEPRPLVNCDVAWIEVTLFNGLRLKAQSYALSLPFLSFDGDLPVPFARVKTTGRAAELKGQTQLELFDQLAAALNLEMSGAEAAALIRADALTSRKGEGWALYTHMRQAIIEHLPLRDSDGRIRTGNMGLDVMSPAEAWQFRPDGFTGLTLV